MDNIENNIENNIIKIGDKIEIENNKCGIIKYISHELIGIALDDNNTKNDNSHFIKKKEFINNYELISTLQWKKKINFIDNKFMDELKNNDYLFDNLWNEIEINNNNKNVTLHLYLYIYIQY